MSKERQIPDWLLESYLLNELSPKRRRQLEKELRENPALRAKLEELSCSDREILNEYPAARLVPDIQKRAAAIQQAQIARPARLRFVLVAVPAMALAIIMLVILPPIFRQKHSLAPKIDREPYIGVKGEKGLSLSTPGLQIFRKDGGNVEKLSDGSQAAAGDLLQLAYIRGDESHGVIVSIDGRGSVTLHFPAHARGDTALKIGHPIFLPTAYKLDTAPRFERFLFVTAKEKIPVNEILEKARNLASDQGSAMTAKLNLPDRFQQFSLLIRK
jgi:hypothetical protein